MNKLEERFEDIIWNKVNIAQEVEMGVGTDCAKEARQLAINCCIAYKLKILTYGQENCPGTIEDIVDNFIEKKYASK